jgi:hypothetical protein
MVPDPQHWLQVDLFCPSWTKNIRIPVLFKENCTKKGCGIEILGKENFLIFNKSKFYFN